MNLESLQKIFMQLITSEKSTEVTWDKIKNGTEAKVFFPGSPRLSGLAQIEIYRNMYEARCIDTIAAEFPVTKNILKGESFDFFREYISSYPSQSHTLNDLSDHLEEFTAKHPISTRMPPILDCVIFEQALYKTFFCKEDIPLTLGSLQSLPQEKWMDLTLKLRSGVDILQTKYPVHQWRKQCDQNASADLDWQKAQPDKFTILVHRKNFTVRFRTLSEAESRLIALINNKTVFPQLCEDMSHYVLADSANPAAAIMGLLSGFIDEELLRNTL